MPTLPPGPRLPYWLQTILIWNHTVPFLRWCRRRYGPTFTLRAYPSKVAVYVTEPADIKAAFAADPDVLQAGAANEILGRCSGAGRCCSPMATSTCAGAG